MDLDEKVLFSFSPWVCDGLAVVLSVCVGSFLWLGQSRKDLFCIWDGDLQLRTSTVQLPPETEMVHLSACKDALWGLDQHGRVHIRSLTLGCPTGMHWTLLDLSQLGEYIDTLTHTHTRTHAHTHTVH